MYIYVLLYTQYPVDVLWEGGGGTLDGFWSCLAEGSFMGDPTMIAPTTKSWSECDDWGFSSG